MMSGPRCVGVLTPSSSGVRAVAQPDRTVFASLPNATGGAAPKVQAGLRDPGFLRNRGSGAFRATATTSRGETAGESLRMLVILPGRTLTGKVSTERGAAPRTAAAGLLPASPKALAIRRGAFTSLLTGRRPRRVGGQGGHTAHDGSAVFVIGYRGLA
jgi:hypothetical protein